MEWYTCVPGQLAGMQQIVTDDRQEGRTGQVGCEKLWTGSRRGDVVIWGRGVGVVDLCCWLAGGYAAYGVSSSGQVVSSSGVASGKLVDSRRQGRGC